jgi:DNA-binding GntR family transcriptional regulator
MFRADMFDLFTTRAQLESQLAVQSTQIGDQGWKGRLQAAYAEMRSFDGESAIDEDSAAAHERFHMALIGGCGSPWSMRVFDMIYSASERYRYFAWRFLVGARDPHKEHADIFSAAMNGEGAKLQRLCAAHVLLTRDLLDKALASNAIDEELGVSA